MIYWVDQRLTQWGTWLLNNRGMGSKGLSAQLTGVPGGSSPQPMIPIASIECSRTHDWVMSLEKEKQQILIEVYVSQRTAKENAAELKISKRTLYSRLHLLQKEYVRWIDEKRILESKPFLSKSHKLCDRSISKAKK